MGFKQFDNIDDTLCCLISSFCFFCIEQVIDHHLVFWFDVHLEVTILERASPVRKHLLMCLEHVFDEDLVEPLLLECLVATLKSNIFDYSATDIVNIGTLKS